MTDHSVDAHPTKRFFVNMLTRDISLEDAMLDLIDNCIDGIARTQDSLDDLSNYTIHITMSDDKFSIKDNCGGIEKETAQKYAFKMGREPDDQRDNDNETIGMYGIGMKRALFKMGLNSIVYSRTDEDAYSVKIPQAWLEDPNWSSLQIYPETNLESILPETGTYIEVTTLADGVRQNFNNAAFVNDLKNIISQLFSLFMKRGLSIYVNGQTIQPLPLGILIQDTEDANVPNPYYIEHVMDDVTITIAVGLNKKYLNLEENEDEESADQDISGWTIFCNDRAIIFGDKTRLTGWGEQSRVPMYHYQFAGITGIVRFRSNNASQLPVTTTKRALDTSSNVWLWTRSAMIEAIRPWITYTNKWKNKDSREKKQHWRNYKPKTLSDVSNIMSKVSETKSNKDSSIPTKVYKPLNIPEPPKADPKTARISFKRHKADIKMVGEYFLSEEYQQKTPTEIGEFCFDLLLEEAKENS